MKKIKFSGVKIIKNNKILLVCESHKEARGLWSFPLGEVENNESKEDGAKREVKEETGYNVSLGDYKEIDINGKDFKSLSKFNNKLINLTIYNASIKNGKILKGKDVLNVKWINIEDLNSLNLRGDWMRDLL
jgi:8-oxo-dGTP diphosphatase